MVITDIDNAAEQIVLSEGLKKAIDFLKDKSNHTLPDERVDVDGDKVFALVQSYDSKMKRDDPSFEAHRKYVDIQYLASGTEIVGWAPLDAVTTTVPYDAEKDAVKGKVAEDEWTPVRLEAGQAMVLYPTDAHAPCLAVDQPEYVKKICMKIAVGS